MTAKYLQKIRSQAEDWPNATAFLNPADSRMNVLSQKPLYEMFELFEWYRECC